MDEYHTRLHEEADRILKVDIPRISSSFQSMLEKPEFRLQAEHKVKAYIEEQCRELIVKRKQLRDVKIAELNEEKRVKEQFSGDRSKLNRGVIDGVEVVYAPVAPVLQGGSTDGNQPAKKKRKLSSNAAATDDSESDSSDDDDETALLKSSSAQARKINAQLALCVSNLRCNPHISGMIEQLKPQLREIVEACNAIKCWIKLLVPRIQDGNNFGVEVQNEILEYVKRLEAEASATVATLSIYHLTRAEVVCKLAKWPGIVDYTVALLEVDTKEFFTLRLIAQEMRNSCYALSDMFKKNIDKVMKPRSNYHENMLCC